MDGIRLVRGKLEATRTYNRRWWTWIQSPGLPCDGFLLLGQTKEKGGDIDEQTYGVDEVPPKAMGYRCFAVRKLGAEIGADDEAYTTQIGPRGVSACSCKAGRTHAERCRHRDGLAALIQAGAIPARQLQGA